MENHEHYKDLWRIIQARAVEMKMNIRGPLPAKYEAPRKANGDLDHLQMNDMLHHCASVGSCFNPADVKRLKKNLYDAFEIPEHERRMGKHIMGTMDDDVEIFFLRKRSMYGSLVGEKYSIKSKLTRQLDNIHFLMNDNDVTCKDHICMNSDCVNHLCSLFENLGGLRRSGYTISKHFNNVLNTLLKLYNVLLINHVPISEDSTDNRWKYFKGYLGALDDTYIPVKVPHPDIPCYKNKK
ncbi:hypothetical protein ACS0TY_003961 [Phlomoides rotata]